MLLRVREQVDRKLELQSKESMAENNNKCTGKVAKGSH